MKLLVQEVLRVILSIRGSSVHEVGCPPAQIRLFGFPEGKLDSRQSDQHHVESVDEEDEEEEPEASIVALAVRLEREVDLVEVGDPVGQMMKVDLRREQNQDQTAAQTCRSDTASLSIKFYLMLRNTVQTRLQNNVASCLLCQTEHQPDPND